MNAASLADLRRHLPPETAAEQPAAAAGAEQSGHASDGSGSAGGSGSNAGTAHASPPDSSGAANLNSSTASPGVPTAAAAAMPHPVAHPADVARFRPNVLVEGPPAFAEDSWRSVRIGPHTFSVTGAPAVMLPSFRNHVSTLRPCSGPKASKLAQCHLSCSFGGRFSNAILVLCRSIWAVRDGVPGSQQRRALGAGAAADARSAAD